MSRAPRVTAAELISALSRIGFTVLRIRGSHHFLRHPDGRTTVIPVNGSETVSPGLLGKILKDCQLTSEDLVRIL
ncbi:MAG: type II toxin-antitoxin system HicA family toxin [Acidobacteriota bacterium]